MTDTPQRHDDAAAVLHALSGSSLTVEQVQKLLAAAGRDLSEERILAILDGSRQAISFSDGSWAHVPTLIDQMILTHRLTPDELRMGVIDVVDVHPFAHLAEAGWPLESGGQVRVARRKELPMLPLGRWEGLAGPEGWLDGYAPGDVIGLRMCDGMLRVEATGEPDLAVSRAAFERLRPVIGAVVRAVSADFEAGRRPTPGIAIGEVVVIAERNVPGVFAEPLLPMTEFLEQAGLEVEGWEMGLPGTPWQGHVEGIDDQQAMAVKEWAIRLAGGRLSGRPPSPESVERVVMTLAGHPGLEPAAELAERHPECEGLLVALETRLSGRERASAAYLASRAAEGRGDPATQEHHLHEAVRADPTPGMAMLDLAELRSCRGDAVEASRGYEAAGMAPTVIDRAVLVPFLPPPPGAISADDPCPCGSGTAYGGCHGLASGPPLWTRAYWLYTKAVEFAFRDRQRQVLVQFDDLFMGQPGRPRRSDFHHAFVVDFALFYGGVMQKFLRERGPLLPGDERALAASWLLGPLRLLEVEAVGDDRIVCRDLRERESFEITGLRAEGLHRLDLLLGRPQADGRGGWAFFQRPLDVPRTLRPALGEVLARDGAGVELATLLARDRSSDTGLGKALQGWPFSRKAATAAQRRRDELAQLARLLRAPEAERSSGAVGALGGASLPAAMEDAVLHRELAAMLDDLEWARRIGEPWAQELDLEGARRDFGLG